ncbi:MAG: hypothetical protein R3E73_06435 [Porticoccaceae bacterium]
MLRRPYGGTQQLDDTPETTVDGVFAIWYAKAPGVDRSCDPLKHGNYGGSHANGGVLVVAGDDHAGEIFHDGSSE